MWSDVAYLGKVIDGVNDIGDYIETISYDNEVYCNEKSIKASEFYQAQSVGMKPEVTLELMAADYSKEKHVKYDDEEYTVLRTYKTSSEKIEITLVRGVNNGNA
ncbi:MAG: hypothetical protein ACRC68_06285 [Clostridium sp.]